MFNEISGHLQTGVCPIIDYAFVQFNIRADEKKFERKYHGIFGGSLSQQKMMWFGFFGFFRLHFGG